jgi:hypothetical protein
MKSKNELFMDAIQFLIDNGKADNQGDVAVKAGLGPLFTRQPTFSMTVADSWGEDITDTW